MFFIFLSLFLLNGIFCQNEVSVFLYTKKTASTSLSAFEININNVNTVVNSIKANDFLCWEKRGECTSYFIIHGFQDRYSSKWINQTRDEIFKRHDKTGLINVFAINWSSKSINYIEIVKEVLFESAKNLNKITISLIDNDYLQTSSDKLTAQLHCIGHSLGAHFCGLFSKEIFKSKNMKVRRITGLDPAGPCIKHWDTDKRLYKDDANFVDIIHTSHVLGMAKPIGHVDFYPNGGELQNGCKDSLIYTIATFFDFNTGLCDDKSKLNILILMEELYKAGSAILCNHDRAHKIFKESINSNCEFDAFKCEGYFDYLFGKCNTNEINLMGLFATKKEGKYYLKTGDLKSSPPLCLNKKCSYKDKIKGVCTFKVKNKSCVKIKDKECGSNNRYSCCQVTNNKLSQRDITFIIETSNNMLSNDQFVKAKEFLSYFFGETEIEMDSTRVALIAYSDSNIQTLSYLDEKKSQESLLNMLNSIKMDETKDNFVNKKLPDALKECENIYKLEKGMRPAEKSFGKQIILLSSEMAFKNQQAVEMSKMFKQKGK